MSTIILHDKKNNNWNSLGFGPLMDAINPLVTRERNGIFDLSFKYPVMGALFKDLKNGRWVVADAGPSNYAKAQRFEIAQITKPINGVVVVYCQHYRYQLLRSILKIGGQFNNINAQTALNQIQSKMEPKGDFTFFSDITTSSSIDLSDPAKFKNVQESLGGVRGSVLDNFGGEYIFNNNQVRLMKKAGMETNIVIAYGKNITDITQEESIENTYTSVYGWAKGEDDKLLTLPETYIDSEYVGNYTQRRILMVDFSENEPKTIEQLRTLIKNYIKNNNVGIPSVNIKTKFVDLASSVMQGMNNLESIDLCDYVTVVFNELEISTQAQIVKTVWNVALDRYESVELGDARTDFAKVISDATDTTKVDDKLSSLEKAQQEASDIIKNPGKGHVIIYPSLSDPQEILILDTMNVNTAKNVWRWNAGGLGFSSTGYNGTYGLAMTNKGSIVADRMDTGTLRAINIIGVAIESGTIKGASIFGGTIKGSEFIQVPNNSSAPMGIQNAALRFFARESDTLDPNKAICSIYGSSSSNGTLILQAGSTIMRLWGSTGANIGSDLEVLGNLKVYKTKNAVHVTRDGLRATPAYEMAESYLGDIGEGNTGSLKRVKVKIDTLFSDCVNTDNKYYVQLTKYSQGDIWVAERHADYFVVCSNIKNMRFCWEIKAKRRGYEKDRLVLQNDNYEKIEEVYREEKEVDEEDGEQNIES